MSHEERREQNIEKVLQQSWLCFQKYGIEATRLGIIAECSGVTTRSIQRYFGTKDELLLASIIFYIDKAVDYSKEMFCEWDSVHKTGLEQVKMFFEIQEMYFRYEYQSFLLFAELEIYFYKKGVSEEMAKNHIHYLKYVRDLFENAVECGMRDGTIRSDINLDVMGTMIMSAYGGMMRRLPMMYKNMAVKDVVDAEVQLQEFAKMIISYLKS